MKPIYLVVLFAALLIGLVYLPLAQSVEIITGETSENVTLNTETTIEQLYIDNNCLVIHECERQAVKGKVLANTRTCTTTIMATDTWNVSQEVLDYAQATFGVTIPLVAGTDYNVTEFFLEAAGIDLNTVKVLLDKYKQLKQVIEASQAALEAQAAEIETPVEPIEEPVE